MPHYHVCVDNGRFPCEQHDTLGQNWYVVLISILVFYALPYLLDCMPRLIKFFFHHVCGLNSRAAYIFLCDADILSDALFPLSTQPANAVCRLTRIPLYANSRTFTSNHTLIFVPTQIPKTHRDTGTVYAAYIKFLNLSYAAYNQGWLTIE